MNPCTPNQMADEEKRVAGINAAADALVSARVAAIKRGDKVQAKALVASLLDRLEDYPTFVALVERLALAGSDSLVREVMHAEAVLAIEAN